MPRARHMATLVAVALTTTLVSAVPSSGQETEPPAATSGGLEPGPWWGAGSARGGGTAVQDGNDVTWTGRIPAQFQFAVAKEDPAGEGIAVGTWEHQGEARLTAIGPQGNFGIDITFTGAGPVGGSDTELILTGTSTTVGPFGIGNTGPIPPQTVTIGAVTCNEAYGEWAYTVEQYFEDEGFNASFTGWWVGVREVEDVQGEVEDILDAFENSFDGTPNEFFTRSPMLGMSAVMLSEFNGFVDDYPDGWTSDRVLDMMARTEALLNAWRNLTECDKKLFGEDNVETFLNGLTIIVQGLIVGAAGVGLDSETFVQLAHAGARTGAYGPGAANPREAVRAEQALIDAGEAILEANVDPEDGEIFVNDDTTRVMATGAAMGWDYNVNGQSISARDTYESAMGESAPPIEGAEEE
jgi:hypothetical protein